MPNERMNCFADTNLIVYTMDPTQPVKRARARDFLNRIIEAHTLQLSPQSLNELYRTLTERRRLASRNEAQAAVWGWSEFCTAPYGFEVTQHAWQIQDRHRFGFWDSNLLASASMAGCNVFLSEDMQHQRTVEDITIINPFKVDPAVFLSR